MNNFPKISVITPSYNQGAYIEQSIKSVLAQDYPDLEFIIIDNLSTDNTLEILNKYKGKLFWVSERDCGQSNAINKGLMLSTGDIVTYLNTDDLYTQGALLKVARFFSAHPEAMWVTGKCRIIDQNGKEVRRLATLYKNFWLRINKCSTLQLFNFISQPATFWRRQLIETVGLFDEQLGYVMDYDYWLRIAKKYPLYVINEYLASFRTHPQSKMRSKEQMNSDEELNVIKKYSTSSSMIYLHKIHRQIINSIYKVMD